MSDSGIDDDPDNWIGADDDPGLSEAFVALANSFADTVGSTEILCLEELCDGVFIADLLTKLMPDRFSLSDEVERDAKVLAPRLANITSIISALSKFFQSEFGTEQGDLSHVNASAIAQNDEGEIANLLQFVLVCLVHGENKEAVIEQLMSLDTMAQEQLMFVINDVLLTMNTAADDAKTSPAASSDHEDHDFSHHSLSMNDSHLDHSHSELVDQLDRIRNELSQVQSANESLENENHKLKLENEALQNDETEDNASKDHRINTLEQQLAKLKKDTDDEIRKLEQAKNRQADQAMAQIQDLQQELSQAQNNINKKNIEIEQIKSESRRLQDDLDIASTQAKKLAHTEAILERYKQRLGEASAMQEQLRDSEEQANEKYARIAELERQTAEIPDLKNQISKWKNMVLELKAEAVEYSGMKESYESELKSLKSKVNRIGEERDFISSQLEEKKQQLAILEEEMQEFAPNANNNNNNTNNNNSYNNAEEVLQLKAQIEELKKSGGSSGASAAEVRGLKDEVELAQQLNFKTQEKYIQAQTKIREMQSEHTEQVSALETKLKETRKALKESQAKAKAAAAAATSSSSSSSSSSSQPVPESEDPLKITITEEMKDAQSARVALLESQSKVDALGTRNKKLEAYIKQLTRKLKERESKLQKTVSQGVTYSEALRSLRKQVKDREAEIQEREKIRLDAKQATAREQRLLSAAFYEIGMEYQSALLSGRVIGRNAQRNQSRSWINQQRARISERAI